MDIRDTIDQQLREHIDTQRRLSVMETPAALVWAEIAQYLRESATHLETFVLPKIEVKTPHVDLRGTGQALRIASFVGATTEEAAEVDELGITIDRPAFLNSHKP